MTKLRSFHFQNLPGQLAQIAEDKASKEERKTFLHDHMASHILYSTKLAENVMGKSIHICLIFNKRINWT